jgi:Family of unknown function (DUF5995)
MQRAVKARTIADVIARMQAIGEGLPRQDGVACFNRLYLAVTQAVLDAHGTFSSPDFLGRLDVRFAELYLHALTEPPRAWQPLLEARSRDDIAPLQFALAGMNAHINRDLPCALVQTYEELGLELRRLGPEYHDYLAVNAILVSTETVAKREFLEGDLRVVDEALGQLDDVVAMWNVERARDAAWTNAETLWSLRALPELAEAFSHTLDGIVGFASRGLLRPIARLEQPSVTTSKGKRSS